MAYPCELIDQAENLEEIKEKAVWSDTFSFFDVEFTLNFDSKGTYKYFNSAYKHLKKNSSSPQKNIDDNFYIMSNFNISKNPLVIVESENTPPLSEIFLIGNSLNRFRAIKLSNDGSNWYALTDVLLGNRPAMMINVKVSVILDLELWKSYAELLIFNSVLTKIPNHFILHAGVASYHDRAMIICGGMNSGKSTLTLGLVKSGFKFLSDEIAFIDLSTSEVMPFPRALGLREEALSRFPELNRNNHEPRLKSLSGDRKWTFDIDEIFPNSIGKKSKIEFIIFLSGFSEKPELKAIAKSEALFESLKYTHTSEEDPFEHILSISDLFKETLCYKFDLGNHTDNSIALRNLLKKN